jgi:manganese transport protein
MDTAPPNGSARRPERRLWRLLGPAFVAAVAYVDPGNVAANISAGARYGYLLVWVILLANVMAVLVQYLSAKFGIVTGRSLPQILGDRLPRAGRILFWLQAECIAIATDLAEVVGGAIALQILFGLPLFLGGVIVGLVSLALLSFHGGGRLRFERVIMAFLGIITVGFAAGLAVVRCHLGRCSPASYRDSVVPRRCCWPRACSAQQ